MCLTSSGASDEKMCAGRIILSFVHGIKGENLFDTQKDVTDATGVTPLRYQPGYLDPLGRTIAVSFRKQFF